MEGKLFWKTLDLEVFVKGALWTLPALLAGWLSRLA